MGWRRTRPDSVPGRIGIRAIHRGNFLATPRGTAERCEVLIGARTGQLPQRWYTRPVLSGAANETRFGTFVAVASKRVTLGIIGDALASCGCLEVKMFPVPFVRQPVGCLWSIPDARGDIKRVITGLFILMAILR